MRLDRKEGEMAHFQDDRPRKHRYAFAYRELLGVARRFAGNLTDGLRAMNLAP